MEELNDEAIQRRETFARFGLAMYHAQCVEKSLAILVSSVFNEEFLPSGLDRREEIQDEVFAKTIGQLLNRLQKQFSVPNSLGQSLEEAHTKRNWLAHNYFWERAWQLTTTAGREGMIEELTNLSAFLSELDSQLAMIYEKWLGELGVDEEDIKSMMKRIKQEHID